MNNAHEAALIEVSLGLCMAFFSLFVIQAIASTAGTSMQPLTVAVAESSQAAAAARDVEDLVVVLFARGRYFDINLDEREAEEVERTPNTLVAVHPRTPLERVVHLQKRFGQGAQITMASSDWRDLLDEKTRGVDHE